MVDDALVALGERAGWTVTDRVATYEPEPGGWRALVRVLTVPGRATDRYHVALVDPRGVAEYTKLAATVVEARRLAEGLVSARA